MDLSTRKPSAQRATVHIAGAEFVNRSGERVRQTAPITFTAAVGLVKE